MDSPYPIGSIQVPGGVEPIVLHRDAVSGGGYMMVATVLSGDLDVAAQSAPRTRTRFVAVDLDTAPGIRAERRRRVSALTMPCPDAGRRRRPLTSSSHLGGSW